MNKYFCNQTQDQTYEQQSMLLRQVGLNENTLIQKGQYDAIEITGWGIMVRKGYKSGMIDFAGNILIPIEQQVLIQPIMSSAPVFCIKNKKKLWGAFNILEKKEVVSFGTFYNMGGYDNDMCMVTKQIENPKFSDRAIIDITGKFVVSFDEYTNVWNHYGKDYPTIIVEHEDKKIYLSKQNPHIITKIEPNVIYH